MPSIYQSLDFNGLCLGLSLYSIQCIPIDLLFSFLFCKPTNFNSFHQPDLIVNDEMNASSDSEMRAIRQTEGFRYHALADERSVSVDLQAEDAVSGAGIVVVANCVVAFAQRLLPRARLARCHRIVGL